MYVFIPQVYLLPLIIYIRLIIIISTLFNYLPAFPLDRKLIFCDKILG